MGVIRSSTNIINQLRHLCKLITFSMKMLAIVKSVLFYLYIICGTCFVWTSSARTLALIALMKRSCDPGKLLFCLVKVYFTFFLLFWRSKRHLRNFSYTLTYTPRASTTSRPFYHHLPKKSLFFCQILYLDVSLVCVEFFNNVSWQYAIENPWPFYSPRLCTVTLIQAAGGVWLPNFEQA
jgi:hypothetical protein